MAVITDVGLSAEFGAERVAQATAFIGKFVEQGNQLPAAGVAWAIRTHLVMERSFAESWAGVSIFEVAAAIEGRRASPHQ